MPHYRQIDVRIVCILAKHVKNHHHFVSLVCLIIPTSITIAMKSVLQVTTFQKTWANVISVLISVDNAGHKMNAFRVG